MDGGGAGSCALLSHEVEGTGSFPGVKGIAEAPCSLRSGTRVGVLAGAPVDIPCLTPLSRLLLSSCGRGSHRWLS